MQDATFFENIINIILCVTQNISIYYISLTNCFHQNEIKSHLSYNRFVGNSHFVFLHPDGNVSSKFFI